MNIELLKQLYEIHSHSREEKKIRRFIRKVAKSCGATSVETDDSGNLLIVKGESETYPCVVAHMDQVQTSHPKDFCCIEGEDVIFGFSRKIKEQCGLGADDKNGVFVALECLKKYDVLKVAFFVGEEIGCVGSRAVDLGFFSDCRFVLEADRRNGGDLITEISGELCSEEFLKAIGYEDFGYSPTNGLTTDVGTLKSRGLNISCVNMSCGYYHPHTDEEFTILSELENCLNFICHIIETCTDVYPHEKPEVSYCNSYRYGDYYWGLQHFPLVEDKKKDEEKTECGEVELFDDNEAMYFILTDEPYLTFAEVKQWYGDYFLTQDENILEQIYTEVYEIVAEEAEMLNGTAN